MRLLLRLPSLLVLALSVGPVAAQQFPVSNQQQLILPIASIGPVGADLYFQTSFHFHNSSNTTLQAELALFAANGADATAWLACPGDVLLPVPEGVGQDAEIGSAVPAVIPVPPVTRLLVEVPANGSVRRTGVANVPDMGFIDGWALLEWEGPPSIEAGVELAVVEGAPPDCTPLREIPEKDIATSAIVGATRSSFEFAVPIVIHTSRETAISIANLSETAAPVDLDFYDAGGVLRDTNTVEIESLHRTSLFAFEWSIEGKVYTAPITPPQRPADFQGRVVIRSEQPIVVGAVEVVLDGLRFLSVPIPVPPVPPFPL